MQDLIHHDFGICVCCGKALQIREIMVSGLPLVQFGCFGEIIDDACPHAQDLKQCENHCQAKSCSLYQRIQDLDAKQQDQAEKLMQTIKAIQKQKKELILHLTTNLVIMKYLLPLLKQSLFLTELETVGEHSLLRIF